MCVSGFAGGGVVRMGEGCVGIEKAHGTALHMINPFTFFFCVCDIAV